MPSSVHLLQRAIQPVAVWKPDNESRSSAKERRATLPQLARQSTKKILAKRSY